MTWPQYERLDGVPQLRPSMVTFADLLGTSEHAAADTAQVTLAALDVALAKARRESDIDAAEDFFFTAWFSDNVAMTAPLGAEALEMQIGLMMLTTSWLQLHLALDGFFLRGGMQFGEQFSDAAITFGPALVDAVRLEHETGFPRVALTALATSIVGIVAVDHFELASNPFNRELAVDQGDGTTFVSYLDSIIDEVDDSVEARQVLLGHRDVVDEQLQLHADDTKVLEKYVWLADYHNFVCVQRDFDALVGGTPGRPFARYVPPASKDDAIEEAITLHDDLQLQ